MREGWCGQLATDEGFSGSGKILVQQCHGTPLKDRRSIRARFWLARWCGRPAGGIWPI
jgi:hypothetical protein